MSDKNIQTIHLKKTSSPETISSTGSEDVANVLVQWRELVNAVKEATRDALSASPSFDAANPSHFQSYWRGVFERLRESVSEDASIPKYLTNRPDKKFTMTLFNVTHSLNCVCCHPDAKPGIILENKAGVTKEDFINGIINHLYGDLPPLVNGEPGPIPGMPTENGVNKEDWFNGIINYLEKTDPISDTPTENGEGNKGVVIYDCNWMQGKSKDGHPTIYESPQNVVLYCCAPENHMTAVQMLAAANQEIKRRKALML